MSKICSMLLWVIVLEGSHGSLLAQQEPWRTDFALFVQELQLCMRTPSCNDNKTAKFAGPVSFQGVFLQYGDKDAIGCPVRRGNLPDCVKVEMPKQTLVPLLDNTFYLVPPSGQGAAWSTLTPRTEVRFRGNIFIVVQLFLVFVGIDEALPITGSGAAPQFRTEQPILPAFLGKTGISPGMWLEIYGSNFSSTTREWRTSDFSGNTAPTALDGVRVNIDGRPAFVRFVSPTQVNVQVPDGIGTGTGITVEVVNSSGSARTTTMAGRVSPALLTTPNFSVAGRQYLAALHTDFRTFVGRENLVTGVPFRPAKPGDTIIVYAVGCGPTLPASPAGQFFNEARPLSSAYEFRFGATIAEAKGYLASQAVGLCQFNVSVPNVATGDVSVSLAIEGVADGQALYTTVQP